jgi:acetyltransferase-like isoleucine patch superfamily enzyme
VNTATSYSLAQAVEKGLLRADPTALIADGVRFVPLEDDGVSRGEIVIGARTSVREGAILCSGVRIGKNSIIGHNVVLRSGAVVGDDTVISHMVCIEHDARIGNNVRVSSLTHLTGSVIVEDDVQIGARVVTVNDNELRWRNRPNLVAPIFRRGCRVGSGVTILSGVEIGKNTLVGAGAVVTRNLPPNVVAYGVPAYVMRDLEGDE